MPDLPISNAAALDHSTIATGDLFPVVDISAATGSKGSKITLGELTTTVNATLLGDSNIFTANGTASTSALSLTGAIFAGGSSTTTKPLFQLEPAGTTSTGWNTAGTLFGLNAPSAFTGDIISVQKEGVKQLSITKDGKLSWGFQGSFDRKPVLYVDGQYAQVEWYQGGIGNINTGAPFEIAEYLRISQTGNANGITLVSNTLGILEQRDLTTAQIFRLNETWTDASNYARLSFITTAGAYSIIPEAAGTGTLRDLILGANAAKTLIQSAILQLGGATSSYPALTYEAGALQVRLADGSGYTAVDAGGYSVGGTPGASGSATGANTLTIVNGIITNIT